MSEINTGGGAAISGNADVGGDLIGRDQNKIGQLNQLNAYLYANELLIQCLNVAVVSDRQAILNNLLAPPKID